MGPFAWVAEVASTERGTRAPSGGRAMGPTCCLKLCTRHAVHVAVYDARLGMPSPWC